MYVDAAVSSFPGDARDPSHHFLPVSEHWLKRFLNTWLAPPTSLISISTLKHGFLHPSGRMKGFSPLWRAWHQTQVYTSPVPIPSISLIPMLVLAGHQLMHTFSLLA